MRLWSLHPKYLDAKGLVALWRESLLAKHVLEGKTKGYKNHPQLNRFKDSASPVDAINFYLSTIYEEACDRKYTFEKSKIDWNCSECKLTVTTGQIVYERKHLLKKLKERDLAKWKEVKVHPHLESHPMFTIIDGIVADWEII
jgi:hypothetical protein